jgi:hypothetical protein
MPMTDPTIPGGEPEGYVFDASCPHCRDKTPHHREIGWATIPGGDVNPRTRFLRFFALLGLAAFVAGYVLTWLSWRWLGEEYAPVTPEWYERAWGDV